MTTSTVSDAELEIIVANRMSHKTVRDIAAELLAFRRARPDRAEVLREALVKAQRVVQHYATTHPQWTDTFIGKTQDPLGAHALLAEIEAALSSPSREPPLNTSAEPVSKAAKIEHESDAGVARDERQQQVAEWCAAAFGADHQSSVPQRGLRFLEEAIEAYQALDGNAQTAHKLIDYIFAKEPGKLFQELGGVGVTLLALAAAAGLSADEAERVEIARVLSKPLEHFWARNKVKNDAGFDALAYPAAAPKPEPSNG